ncbi:hypothetical protein NM688_g5896 [Phlebia brevispora]|uniref:Uncharacterized protein n=1 Tax=Phlebia brevispora TaxID=194682 RepID=A0ACC1SN79_9APHY|nr:hypothetical protein NM688_g5896 [Phlebia brevispora]
MALLGLFAKRDKYKSPASTSSAPKSSGGSLADSNEDYVLPETIISPALPNAVYGNPEASSSKFHLGFHRKRANNAPEQADPNLLRPPNAVAHG